MKVLWSVNIPINEAAELLHIDGVPTVSWMDYLSQALKTECDFTICFPTHEVTELKHVKGDRVTFYAIPRKSKGGYEYEPELTAYYRQIIGEVKPDVIQQWGSEFPNCLNLLEAAETEDMLDHTMIHIQGIISLCAKETAFYASLPERVVKGKSLKEYVTGNHLVGLRRKMAKQGEYEVKAFQKVKHVCGRTGFDKAFTELTNPNIQYHYCSETLRKEFYEGKWSPDTCEKHRVFMSQGGIPYKGMHFALAALKKVKERYPDVHLYLSGRNLLPGRPFKEWIRFSNYECYISKLIKEYGLEENVTFLGNLNAEQMREQYLKANVYILPSAIDNSPNSLGEAMVLGVPVVAADVGGVKDLCTRNEEGFLYQHDADYMLAGYILQVFEEPIEDTLRRCNAARKHAMQRFDPEKNKQDLLTIYRDLSGKE